MNHCSALPRRSTQTGGRVVAMATTVGGSTIALFTSNFFCKIGIIVLSFVYGNYCLIMD